MDKPLAFNKNLFGSKTSTLVFILALISIAVIFIVPQLIERNWGFNSVYFMPDYLFYIWILIGLLAAVNLMITPREHFIAEYLKEYYWGDKKMIGRIGTIILFLILFVLFRMETQYYGGGLLNIANFTQRAEPVIGWYNFGGVGISYLLFLLLKGVGINAVFAGLWSLQMISYISGAIFLYYTFKVSELISDDYNQKLGIFFMILFFGGVLFFFGTVEQCPMLLAVMVIFFYFLLKYVTNHSRRELLNLIILFVIGLLINFQFITLLPAVAYIVIKSVIKRRSASSFAGNLAAVVLLIVPIVIVYMKSFGDIHLENLILYFSGKPPEVDYGLFGGAHLLDILNLFYLAIPMILVTVPIILISFRYMKGDLVYAVLGYITVGQIIFLIISDPKNGMARDLSDYVFLMTGLLFWSIYALYKNWENLRLTKETVLALAPATLVVIFPMLYVHLAPEASFNYLDKYLGYNETKFESAIYAMRDYYNLAGDTERSIQVESSLKSKAPGALESQLINDLYAQNRVNEAFEYALRLTERNPYKATYRMQKGNLLKHFGKIAEAEKELITAVKLDPYDIEAWHFLSELYRETKREAKCFMALEIALENNPENDMLMVDLTGYYFRAKKFNLVDSLTTDLERINPDEPYIYMYRGLIAEGNHKKDKAMKLYEKFVSMAPNYPEVTVIRKRINAIFLEKRDDSLNSASPETD